MSLKRSILFVSIALFMAGRVFSQTAQDFEVTFTEDGEGVVIKKFTGKLSSTIRIPAAIEGLPVKEIGERAFIGAGTVTNAMKVMTTNIPFAVVLPQGLIKIGANAFSESAITSVVIPDSVTEIGELAFANYVFYARTGTFKPPTPLLSSITLPRGLSKVGSGAFMGNSALKTVVIPEGCSALGEKMFAECTALTAITIPKSITSIPARAFASTALSSVTLHSTITAIGNDAFHGCSALTTVTIPEPVETIDGGYIGSEHHGYSGDYDYERTLLEWAFRECGKLSLAAQARLKKITAFSYQREQEKEQEKLEQAQRQREEEERIAQKKREQEEREAERAAQAKREQEAREAAQAERAEEMRVQQAKQAEATETVLAFHEKFQAFAFTSGGMNKKQFAEFMDLYEKFIAYASGLENLDASKWGWSERQNFERSLTNIGDNIRRCMIGMNNSQKKQFDAKFKGHLLQ